MFHCKFGKLIYSGLYSFHTLPVCVHVHVCASPHSQLNHAKQDKQRWRVDKTQLEQTLQENKERMEKLEGYWMEAQSLCQAVDEHLKETQAQYQALERKYSKAKRLIKEYQQK